MSNRKFLYFIAMKKCWNKKARGLLILFLLICTLIYPGILVAKISNILKEDSIQLSKHDNFHIISWQGKNVSDQEKKDMEKLFKMPIGLSYQGRMDIKNHEITFFAMDQHVFQWYDMKEEGLFQTSGNVLISKEMEELFGYHKGEEISVKGNKFKITGVFESEEPLLIFSYHDLEKLVYLFDLQQEIITKNKSLNTNDLSLYFRKKEKEFHIIEVIQSKNEIKKVAKKRWIIIKREVFLTGLLVVIGCMNFYMIYKNKKILEQMNVSRMMILGIKNDEIKKMVSIENMLMATLAIGSVILIFPLFLKYFGFYGNLEWDIRQKILFIVLSISSFFLVHRFFYKYQQIR